MVEADIINILSGIAGVIGAVTGTISLIQVKKLKSQDLRLERGRLVNALQVNLDDLKGLAEKVNRSRVYRFAAQGLANSGSMQQFQADFEKNKKAIQELSQEFLILKTVEASGKNLEEQILHLHLIEEKLKSLIAGFEASIAEDDVARDRLSGMKFGT
jgi:hypothetical protein